MKTVASWLVGGLLCLAPLALWAQEVPRARPGDEGMSATKLERAAAQPDALDDPVVWDHLGDVCLKLNDRSAAAAAWQRAIELFESNRTRRPDERYHEVQEKRRRLLSP